jgi:hypothetical protein
MQRLHIGLAACWLPVLAAGCALPGSRGATSLPDPVRRDHAAPQRAAVIVAIAGGVAAAGAIGCTIAGAAEDESIENGGFATGKDIAAAASRGDAYNQAAFVSGAIAIGALAAAFGLYMYGSPPARRGEHGRGVRPGVLEF